MKLARGQKKRQPLWEHSGWSMRFGKKKKVDENDNDAETI